MSSQNLYTVPQSDDSNNFYYISEKYSSFNNNVHCTLFTEGNQFAFFDFPLSLYISSCWESPAWTTHTLKMQITDKVVYFYTILHC